MMYRGTIDKKVSFDTKEELYAYQQGRNDAIDGCLEIIEKIMPTEPFLKNSKHYENWKMKTTELRMLRSMLEQMKGEIE